jgi:hypothetical protein
MTLLQIARQGGTVDDLVEQPERPILVLPVQETPEQIARRMVASSNRAKGTGYLVTDGAGRFWWTGKRWTDERADGKRYRYESAASGVARRVLGKVVPL